MGDYTSLEIIASELKLDVLHELFFAQSGHPGGSFSCTEIMTALYFGGVMDYRSKDPKWPKRDKLVLSKGHAAPMLYAALARADYFNRHLLWKLRKIDSKLQGHPHPKTPGVECVTGSLGQGLSIAKGIALADRLDKNSSTTYVILGDGELQEGQIYEARRNIAHLGLSSIVAVLDHNGLQLDGEVEKISRLGDIKKGWEAAGWNVIGQQISHQERLDKIGIDGHDFSFIIDSLKKARKSDKPSLIIANTIKGNGVSFMENNYKYHGKQLKPDEYTCALSDLISTMRELYGRS
jgi:transketolase